MKTHYITGVALLACVCLSVVQYNSVGNRRVVLEETAKGPQYVPVITGNGFGTNSAFLGKGDGSGTSVKGIRTQSLLMPRRFTPGYTVKQQLPNAGAVGTDKAFMGKFDGVGQSTKSRFQQLSQQYLGYGQKARSFYKTPTVWQQIGAQEPSQAAHSVMKQNDDFGYKAPVQSLLECGRGGPCPFIPGYNKKHGISSQAERKWAKSFPVESAADKARIMQLAQLTGDASSTVAKDVTGYLFKKAHIVGL